jgi:hypothetical protein
MNNHQVISNKPGNARFNYPDAFQGTPFGQEADLARHQPDSRQLQANDNFSAQTTQSPSAPEDGVKEPAAPWHWLSWSSCQQAKGGSNWQSSWLPGRSYKWQSSARAKTPGGTVGVNDWESSESEEEPTFPAVVSREILRTHSLFNREG